MHWNGSETSTNGDDIDNSEIAIKFYEGNIIQLSKKGVVKRHANILKQQFFLGICTNDIMISPFLWKVRQG